MSLEAFSDVESCYRALRARDERFDGVFYVGVKTTGIYCRPICPARTPRRERCEFFERAAQAEGAGYRACLRCRPELAPGGGAVDSVSRLVRDAMACIETGFLNDHSIHELASSLSVSTRHLRRVMEAEIGVSPVALAQTRRLSLAKQLIQDTQLPLSDVAFAAGFNSVRRFNALIRERFGRTPSEMRRGHDTGATRGRRGAPSHASDVCVPLRLDYRPPFAWSDMLTFLQHRAIPGVEVSENDEYRRSVAIDGKVGWLAVRADPARDCLRARVSLSLVGRLMPIVVRIRSLFDLDAHPDRIVEQLRDDPVLGERVRARPGLRVPGAFDGFETAVRTILGQQVSVRGATTLSGRFVERFGKKLTPDHVDAAPDAPLGVTMVFPDPATIAATRVEEIREIGLPAARARTILELAQALVSGRVELSPSAAPEAFIEDLQALPGIGPWTAHYLAMRVLHWPDAFPAGDLGVRNALGAKNARDARARATAWQPWRAYAVMHLWRSLGA